MVADLLGFFVAEFVKKLSVIILANLLLLLYKVQKHYLLSLTQDDLASILGISRVNVARQLAQLKSEDIIQVTRQHIKIINLDKLLSYCSLETV